MRRKLLETCDVHTLLRLPTGIFYSQGVKANVLFFDNKPASKTPWTKDVWIYDFRTNIHFTLKKNPLKFEDLADFIHCYNPENIQKRKETYHPEKNPEGRWRWCFVDLDRSLNYANVSNNLFSAMASGMVVFHECLDNAEFRAYWLFGAVLNFPFLAQGEVHLLSHRRWLVGWTHGAPGRRLDGESLELD